MSKEELHFKRLTLLQQDDRFEELFPGYSNLIKECFAEIDRLLKELEEASSVIEMFRLRAEKAESQYEELIYAVGMKYQNETRHETALRYIREREIIKNEPAQQED